MFEQIDLRNVVGEARFANISTEAGPKPLILIADDEKDLVNALEEFFEKSGYAVATAYNGVEAIEKINREKPRLILLDLMMPVMDGFQVLEQLRRDQKDTPVIVLSGLGEQTGDIAISLGANIYLQKPYSFSELEQQARKLLRSA